MNKLMPLVALPVQIAAALFVSVILLIKAFLKPFQTLFSYSLEPQ